jgi:TRAP-type C4-dicarboxylate transport system substrate-binding protein
MKKYLPVFVALLMISVLFLAGCTTTSSTTAPATSSAPPASTSAPAKVTLRLVIPVPPTDKLTINAQELADAVKQRTNGQYEINIVCGETLAKVPEYLDAVRTGTVEMASVGLGMFAGAYPQLVEIPMIYNNVQANAAACKPMADLYNTFLPTGANARAVAIYTTGANDLVSKKSVQTLADWKGLLIGTVSPQLSAMASNMGAAAVVISWVDCYSVLEKGTVDAVTTSTQWTMISKLNDVSKYYVRFYGSPSYNTYLINLDAWNKMPKDVQDIFTEEAWKASDKMSNIHIQAVQTDKEDLEKLGMTVYDVPKEERDKWIAANAPTFDKMISDLGDFGTKVKAIAEDVNAKNP